MNLAQQLVRLSGVNGGFFIRGRDETVPQFEDRILEQEQQNDDDEGGSKVLAYFDATEAGAVMPPVFVLERDGELALLDGWHRCAAAGLRGRAAVRAVVVKVGSVAQENAVSQALYELSAAGVSWQEQARAVERLLAA